MVYAKWENFSKVIDKSITSCHKAGYGPGDHFTGIIKMVVERWGFWRENRGHVLNNKY
jgi:hypothetical protein